MMSCFADYAWCHYISEDLERLIRMEFVKQMSTARITDFYNDEEMYIETDRKWVKSCVICKGILDPFHAVWRFQCCTTAYLHEGCRIKRDCGQETTIGAVNERAGHDLEGHPLDSSTVKSEQCWACRRDEPKLFRVTDHFQYSANLACKCPFCSREMAATDLLQHVIERCEPSTKKMQDFSMPLQENEQRPTTPPPQEHEDTDSPYAIIIVHSYLCFNPFHLDTERIVPRVRRTPPPGWGDWRSTSNL